MTEEGVQLNPEPLPGTVKFYRRHLFVCTGPVDWPERIELGGGFLQALAEAIGRRAEEMSLPVKMTACDDLGRSDSGYDILVFPDQIRYLSVQEADLPTLVEEHLVANRVSEAIPHEPLPGHHVFICTHGRRDPRCGQCGPPLVEEFTMALKAHNLTDRVVVRRTSHVGGHKFAGNVLIYPEGDWYGYVTPDDVRRMVEQYFIKGQVVTELWRGRMGLSSAEQLEWHRGA
jgi:hypothetical protein